MRGRERSMDGAFLVNVGAEAAAVGTARGPVSISRSTSVDGAAPGATAAPDAAGTAIGGLVDTYG